MFKSFLGGIAVAFALLFFVSPAVAQTAPGVCVCGNFCDLVCPPGECCHNYDFTCTPDPDNDGIHTETISGCIADNCPNVANPDQLDTDMDGIGDACEIAVPTPTPAPTPTPTPVDPCLNMGGDSDGDGVCDDVDNCPAVPNPGQADGDGDGIGDACAPVVIVPQDPCETQGGDQDQDDVCDNVDNCTGVPNPGQEDADGDRRGDDCDDCTDGDNDGYGDLGSRNNTCPTDNCPTVSNPAQVDADGDGQGDVCDGCTDLDGDGVGDPGFAANTCGTDNCPRDPNPGQLNTDGDGSGDECDDCVDLDRDGFGDPGFARNICPLDNCPMVPNPMQDDSDGDGEGDLCDPTPTGGVMPGEVSIILFGPGGDCGPNPLGLEDAAPLFQWSSSAGLFDLTVYERRPSESGDTAIQSRPVAQFRDIDMTSFVYPPFAEDLRPGGSYAYQVRALDERGEIVAESEVWCFKMASDRAKCARVRLSPAWIATCHPRSTPLQVTCVTESGDEEVLPHGQVEFEVLPRRLGRIQSGVFRPSELTDIRDGVITAKVGDHMAESVVVVHTDCIDLEASLGWIDGEIVENHCDADPPYVVVRVPDPLSEDGSILIEVTIDDGTIID